MSCCKKCDCCVERIKVTSVTTDVTTITLHETTIVLADLPVGKEVEIDVDPDLLPESTLPVVLTDGTTTIPLWKTNGNVFRETQFLPFARCKAKCFQFARILARYFDDPAHLYVYRSKPRRY